MADLLPEIPNFLDNALKNISDEPTKSIGALIKDAIFLKFGSISYKAQKLQILQKYGLKEFEDSLAKSINEIPVDNLQIPDFQTVTQAIGDMESCINSEDLRKMFANLIARACNMDFKNFIHPSFSTILGQMSPFDAKILKFYVDNKPERFITYTYKSSDRNRFDRIPYMFDTYPNAEESPHVSLSISALMRFGLLAIHDDAIMYEVTDSPFVNTEFYKRCEQERIEEGKYQSSEINGQASIITPYGYAFIQSCF